MENRPELWKLYNLSQTFGQLPSQVLELDWVEPWERYQFNSAVFTLGRKVENALNENAAKGKKRTSPAIIVQRFLFPDPAKRSYDNALLDEFGGWRNNRRDPTRAVKVKPGMTPREILRLK